MTLFICVLLLGQHVDQLVDVFQGQLVLALDVVGVELELEDQFEDVPVVIAIVRDDLLCVALDLQRQLLEYTEALADLHL
jgi:hypothetical protein